MSTSRDWLSNSREGILSIARDWKIVVGTNAKKDVIEFEFGDSGKNCCMAAQIENEGKKSPWGPLVSALIP
jgi:hypothetical protein